MKSLPYKTLADATLLLAVVSYIAILCALTCVHFGLWGTLGVVLYGMSFIWILSILSSLARAVFLYQSPNNRRWHQILLLVIALIPLMMAFLEMVS